MSLRYYATVDGGVTNNHSINQMKPLNIDNSSKHYYTTDNPSGWYFDLGEVVAGRPVYKKYHVGCTTQTSKPQAQPQPTKFGCTQPHWGPDCR